MPEQYQGHQERRRVKKSIWDKSDENISFPLMVISSIPTIELQSVYQSYNFLQLFTQSHHCIQAFQTTVYLAQVIFKQKSFITLLICYKAKYLLTTPSNCSLSHNYLGDINYLAIIPFVHFISRLPRLRQSGDSLHL